MKISYFAKRWFVDATSALAVGLFSSLIVGLILTQISKLSGQAWLLPLAEVINPRSPVIGCAIGTAIAFMLKNAPLVVCTSVVTGAIGYAAGGPVGAYVAALVGAEMGALVAGRTQVDIVLTPCVVIVAGGLAGQLIGPPMSFVMAQMGTLINEATQLQPFLMGAIVSLVMGMLLTSPLSSAALAISMGLDGLAAGAATVGCCANMIGFSVMSHRDNRLGTLLALGVGTSMLQVPNIIKKPWIWLPTMFASLVLGPLATMVFMMKNNAVGAGMGTSGLVGQINTYIVMAPTEGGTQVLLKMALLHFILPALLTYFAYRVMRHKGWIKDGDLALKH